MKWGFNPENRDLVCPKWWMGAQSKAIIFSSTGKTSFYYGSVPYLFVSMKTTQRNEESKGVGMGLWVKGNDGESWGIIG